MKSVFLLWFCHYVSRWLQEVTNILYLYFLQIISQLYHPKAKQYLKYFVSQTGRNKAKLSEPHNKPWYPDFSTSIIQTELWYRWVLPFSLVPLELTSLPRKSALLALSLKRTVNSSRKSDGIWEKKELIKKYRCAAYIPLELYTLEIIISKSNSNFSANPVNYKCRRLFVQWNGY